MAGVRLGVLSSVYRLLFVARSTSLLMSVLNAVTENRIVDCALPTLIEAHALYSAVQRQEQLDADSDVCAHCRRACLIHRIRACAEAALCCCQSYTAAIPYHQFATALPAMQNPLVTYWVHTANSVVCKGTKIGRRTYAPCACLYRVHCAHAPYALSLGAATAHGVVAFVEFSLRTAAAMFSRAACTHCHRRLHAAVVALSHSRRPRLLQTGVIAAAAAQVLRRLHRVHCAHCSKRWSYRRTAASGISLTARLCCPALASLLNEQTEPQIVYLVGRILVPLLRGIFKFWFAVILTDADCPFHVDTSACGHFVSGGGVGNLLSVLEGLKVTEDKHAEVSQLCCMLFE